MSLILSIVESLQYQPGLLWVQKKILDVVLPLATVMIKLYNIANSRIP